MLFPLQPSLLLAATYHVVGQKLVVFTTLSELRPLFFLGSTDFFRQIFVTKGKFSNFVISKYPSAIVQVL
jgi:hypothetical protein